MTSIDTETDKILVLGAGELGHAVLRELVALRQEGFSPKISVLLRPADQIAGSEDELRAELGAMGLAIVEADLATSSAADLAVIFADYAQIIGCTGFVGGPGTQRKITAAAIEAGVRHYIPWQFGVDYDVVGLGSGQEVFDEQYEVREMLRAQSAIRWTIISTGMFTSFVFLPAFGLVDLERTRMHALGDWSYRLTVTPPEDIGKMTALVASQWQSYQDRIVYIAGDTFTYSQLADTLDRVTGRTFERTLWDTAQLRAEVQAHPGDTMRKYRLAFARPDGVAWPMEETLNAKLGISTTSVEQWLRRSLSA